MRMIKTSLSLILEVNNCCLDTEKSTV